MDVTRRPGYQLKRAQHALRTAMDLALRDIGITTPQYAALNALAGGPLSGAELARRCFVTPQSMNGVLVNLDHVGMIARGPHLEHGRVIEATLSHRGRAALRRAHDAVEIIETQMLKGFSSRERERLSDALERCADNLGV